MPSQRVSEIGANDDAMSPTPRVTPVMLRAIDGAAGALGGRISATAQEPGKSAGPGRPLETAPVTATPQPGRRIHPRAVASVVQFIDLVVTMAVGIVIFTLQSEFHWPIGLLPASTTVLVLALMARMPKPGPNLENDLTRRPLPGQIVDGAVHALSSFAFALLVVVAVLLPDAEARGPLVSWLSLWAFGTVAGIAMVRVILSLLMARWRAEGRLKRLIAIFGAGELAERLVERLQASCPDSIEIVGVFDDRTGRRVLSPRLRGLMRGTTAELIELSRQFEIDRVVVALPHSAEQRVLEIMHTLHKMPVEISLAPDMVGFSVPSKDRDEFGGLPLLNVYVRPLTFSQRLVKSVFDRMMAGLALLVASPVLLGVALTIKLDSKGPVLFRQNRYGFGDRVIQVYKFRTMKAETADANGEKQTAVNDPRITRVGGSLRRWSLDELPQLFNVLRGELSLVGPRPHAVSMTVEERRNEDIVPDYALRHHVKPGITGWAQVNGFHGPVATEKALLRRVAYDLDYINNWSLWFDIRILFGTIMVAFGHREAY
jgi:Undecaprenyl-phosphate glucose phosphotransferase